MILKGKAERARASFESAAALVACEKHRVRSRILMSLAMVMTLAAVMRKDSSARPLRCHSIMVVSLALLVTGWIDTEAQGSPEHYPGQHVAACKPAPIAGCVCNTDAFGELPIFPLSVNDASATDRIGDAELLRLLDWLRRTCMALTQGTDPR